MASAHLLFVVPRELDELAGILVEHGAEGDLYGIDAEEDALAYLADRVGQAVGVEFGADDPTEPVYDLMRCLDGRQAPYWACHDAFVEPSRGIRVGPRVFLNLDGTDRRDLRLAWEDGPPALDARTLKAAGLAPSMAEAAEARFLAGAPAPRP